MQNQQTISNNNSGVVDHTNINNQIVTNDQTDSQKIDRKIQYLLSNLLIKYENMMKIDPQYVYYQQKLAEIEKKYKIIANKIIISKAIIENLRTEISYACTADS